MKTKLVLLFALLCWGGFSISYAQITTGKPSSKVIRTGNRAQAGDFGIYLGATSDMVQAFDKDVNFSALPLINFKYMVTNQLEARLGLELYKTSKTLKGEVSKILIPSECWAAIPHGKIHGPMQCFILELHIISQAVISWMFM